MTKQLWMVAVGSVAFLLAGCGQGSPSEGQRGSPSEADNGLEGKCGAFPEKPSKDRWREYLSCLGSYANENYEDRQIMTLLDGIYEADPNNFIFVSSEIDPRKNGRICKAALEECATAGDPMFCFEQKHPYWSNMYKAAGRTCLEINY